MAVSKESLIYSYVLTFALLLTVMTNSCQYMLHHQPKKEGWWPQWAPFILMSMATVLLVLSPLKNLVVNVCMASFHENGYDATIGFMLDLAYRPQFGTPEMQAYTLLGYLLMMWATALQIGLPDRIYSGLLDLQANYYSKAHGKMPLHLSQPKAACGPAG
mmetsp:Transcript_28625/g.75804  ORF Transcript_28625/g.75804 Transcript_28625/m.75804 type:complete len:160 (-) Transcript_28625:99-578(-)